MTQITFSDLPALRQKHANQQVVFCSGGFDLTHAGHVLFFEDCRKQGDVLVVGLGCDAVRRREKGDDRPIVNEHMRLKLISSLKPVDYAFVIPDFTVNHIFEPILHVLEALKPDIYVMNTDAYDIPLRQKMIGRFPVKIVVLERCCPPEFENVSTTKLIEKIKRLQD